MLAPDEAECKQAMPGDVLAWTSLVAGTVLDSDADVADIDGRKGRMGDGG
jgi:hypothetical protein